MTAPFKVESHDISRLNDVQLTKLLKELLHAEAYKFGIAQRCVEVALNIRVGDGGEDGRISWDGHLEETDYIPNKLTMFQNKATDMSPSEYAKEILVKTRSGEPRQIKPKVDEVLNNGGSYIVFTTQELNTSQKYDGRLNRIRETLTELRKPYANSCDLKIYDAAQIASWVNCFISAVVSVQEWLGQPTERGLKSFDSWSKHPDLTRFPFSDVNSRSEIIKGVRTEIATSKSCIRIEGLSGLGKTRTSFRVFEQAPDLQSLVVYIDANNASNLVSLVSDWVALNLRAILVVDNCEYKLHNDLVREVTRLDSELSLLTLDYNFESVSSGTLVFRLEKMLDEEIKLILSSVYNDQIPDLDRIVSFAQGFPQIAVLIAESRLTDDPRVGELSDDEIMNKLLWKRGEDENTEHLKILQACSLFDIFGLDNDAAPQLDFIANLVGFNVDAVYECIQKYINRGLVDRRGRFGQVVPKPLAIRLAGQWWNLSREEKQLALLAEIPESMVNRFCLQIEKMDFHPNVKKISEQLCGPQGPFGQAEVILSIRGSRLFRSFVVVNPVDACASLSNVLSALTHEELIDITGDVRRNLVVALEMLCFHGDIFEDAAWCSVLLASAENETWANNATGLFEHLYSIRLSGTEAIPSQKFEFLERVLESNDHRINELCINALARTLDDGRASRTVGAEHQGTKAPLQEWQPTVWQEIFDYWRSGLSLLLQLYEEHSSYRDRIQNLVGRSIRNFIRHGRIEMLDDAINRIVSIQGQHWPSALESIKHALKYDARHLNEGGTDALNRWLEKLSYESASLDDQIKIVVVNPPREHIEGDDGRYRDIAAENAEELAVLIAKDIDQIYPYICLLLDNDQRQAYAFGRKLVLVLQDSGDLVSSCLEEIAVTESPNIDFLRGIFRGSFELSPALWDARLTQLLDVDGCVRFYPDIVRTGAVSESHLELILELAKGQKVSENSINLLSYGSATENISAANVANFCILLAGVSQTSGWVALNIIFMHCVSNDDAYLEIDAELKMLVSLVPLHENQEGALVDFYHWHELVNKLLETNDLSFLESISRQLIKAANTGLEHGAVWDHFKPIVIKLIELDQDDIWPIFGEAIVNSSGRKRYWLYQLLERGHGLSDNSPSVLSSLRPELLIQWCFENPDPGPVFVAGSINVFVTEDGELQPNPIVVELLMHFGNDESVKSALSSSLWNRGWSGSLVPYLQNEKVGLESLIEHEHPNVRGWAKEHISLINKQIGIELTREEENSFGIY